MKIDVEGHELQALKGFNFSKYRPKVIVVESVNPVDFKRESTIFWHELILNGYKFVYFDGLNDFFVAIEAHDLFKHFLTPISVFDGNYFVTNHS